MTQAEYNQAVAAGKHMQPLHDGIVECSTCMHLMSQQASVDLPGRRVVVGGVPVLVNTEVTRSDGLENDGIPPFICRECVIKELGR